VEDKIRRRVQTNAKKEVGRREGRYEEEEMKET
jgi:hypothetical protein